LDLKKWNRKELFYFFKEYEQPFFNICADVDVTSLVKFTKERNISFFKSSLYLSLKTANEIEPFRYRIRANKLIVAEVIDGGSTVLTRMRPLVLAILITIPILKNSKRRQAKN